MIKGIIRYLIILLALCVAVGVVTIGIMYFFPNVNLFGYHFYHGNLQKTYIEVRPDTWQGDAENVVKVNEGIAKNFEVLHIISKGFDIELTTFNTASSSAPLFQYTFCSNMKGLKNIEDATPEVLLTTDINSQNKKVLKIEVSEPRGLFFRSNTFLKLYLPVGYLNRTSFEKLTIENESGKTLVYSELGDFLIKNAEIICNSGLVKFNDVDFSESLSVTKESGNFYMNEDISASVTLNCGAANFYFNNLKDETTDYTNPKLTVLGNNSLVSVKDIEGSARIMMEYGSFKAQSIYGELDASSNPNTNAKNSCDFNIQKVLKTVVVNSDSGSIKIGQTSSIGDSTSFSLVEIANGSGDVKIDKCFSKDVKIISGRGKVSLSKCVGTLDISTTYGDIDIEYLKAGDVIGGVTADEITNAVALIKNRNIKLATGRDGLGNGNIFAKNISCASSIISLGSGYISVQYLDIDKTNEVNSFGKIEIKVPNNKQYLLKWLAKKSADVQVLTINTDVLDSNDYQVNPSIVAGDGWLKILGATDSCQNKLFVNSKNSNITINT